LGVFFCRKMAKKHVFFDHFDQKNPQNGLKLRNNNPKPS